MKLFDNANFVSFHLICHVSHWQPRNHTTDETRLIQ